MQKFKKTEVRIEANGVKVAETSSKRHNSETDRTIRKQVKMTRPMSLQRPALQHLSSKQRVDVNNHQCTFSKPHVTIYGGESGDPRQ